MQLEKAIKNTISYTFSQSTSDFIHIGYGIDDNFSRCAGTSIISICKNNIDKNFHFHIIGLNISDINKLKFKQLAQQKHINISIYEIDPPFFDKLPTKTNLPIPTYFRFLLPIVLKTIPKIYYIDSDVICLKSLSSFFNIDLDNNIIGAVADDKWINDLQNEKLNLQNHIYFNAGILIIDTLKWNASHITKKLLDVLTSSPEKFSFLDQDALNLVLSKNVKYIDQKYNYNYRNNKNIKLKNNICLLHFVHVPKPWHLSWYICDNINSYNKYLYRNLENLTPWRNLPFTLPKTYKEMRFHSMYLRKNGYYLKAIYWQIKYLIHKILYYITYCAS